MTAKEFTLQQNYGGWLAVCCYLSALALPPVLCGCRSFLSYPKIIFRLSSTRSPLHLTLFTLELPCNVCNLLRLYNHTIQLSPIYTPVRIIRTYKIMWPEFLLDAWKLSPHRLSSYFIHIDQHSSLQCHFSLLTFNCIRSLQLPPPIAPAPSFFQSCIASASPA